MCMELRDREEICQDLVINLISTGAETYLPDINTKLWPFVLHFCNFGAFFAHMPAIPLGSFGFFKGFVTSLPCLNGICLPVMLPKLSAS